MDTGTAIAIVGVALTAVAMLGTAIYAVARIESAAATAGNAIAKVEDRLDAHDTRLRTVEQRTAVLASANHHDDDGN